MKCTKTLKPCLFVLAFIHKVMVFENTLSTEPQYCTIEVMRYCALVFQVFFL